jgi:Family of unknown function (DUF6461)
MRLILRTFMTMAVIGAFISMLFSTGPGAQASESPAGMISVRLSTPPVSMALGGAQPAAPGCKPGLGRANRTVLCWPGFWTLHVYDEDGDVVGEIQFTTVQYMHLNVIGRAWTEDITITSVTDTDTVPPYVLMSVSANCGSPCRATVHFSQNFIAVGTSGTISYYDSIGSGKMNSTKTTGGEWALGIEPNGFLGVTDEAVVPLSARATLVSHYRNFNAGGSFLWIEDGDVRLRFNPQSGLA